MQWNVVVCAKLSGSMAAFEGAARHTVVEARRLWFVSAVDRNNAPHASVNSASYITLKFIY